MFIKNKIVNINEYHTNKAENSLNKNKITHNKFFKKILILSMSVFLISSLLPLQSVLAASVSYSSLTNLSSSLGTSDSQTPQIITSGSNVYVVWREADNIRFLRSTDGGVTFPGPIIDIGDTTSSSTSGNPMISVEGNNVYTVWREGEQIKFNSSDDNGLNFRAASIQLSSSTDSTSNREPKTATSANGDVHFVWRDREALTDSRILFTRSADGGDNFGSIVEIDPDSDSSSPDPHISTSGSNVYVVWQDGTNILVARSTNSGVSFSSVTDVGDTLSASIRSLPQISASGSNVHVVWRDSTTIKAAISTNSGDSYSAAVTIGNTGAASFDVPSRLAVSGSTTYVVWQDNNSGAGDIMFAKSVSGAAFGSGTNLSGNSGLSTIPVMAASDTNVFVAWRDFTTDSVSGDILLTASSDSGATFGSATNISNTSGDSSTEIAIASSTNKVFASWKDSDPGNNDIFYKSGTISAVSVDFDSAQYKLSNTATITVTDSSSSGAVTIIVNVKSSTTDPTTIPITLTEGPLGTFTGTITFTESGSSSGTTLEASPGDTITASFSGVEGTATIFSRSIDFSGVTSFNLGSFAHPRVTDQNSNTNTGVADTVTITVTSSADPTGVSLTLTETGLDTGVFGGASGSTQSDLIFTESTGLVPISTTTSITITQTDGGNSLGNSAAVIDQIIVDVTSTSDPTGIEVVLTETDASSTVYSGELFISQTSSNDLTDTILVAAGNYITVTNQAGTPQESLLLMTPSDPDVDALQVSTPSDTSIIATYNGASITVSLFDALAPGGGGGGLVRPGLVVNILAAAVGGGGGLPGPTFSLGAVALSDSGSEKISMPQEIRDIVNNHDPNTPLEPITDIYEDFDLPLSINGNGFALGGYENTLVTQPVNTGEPIEFTMVFYTTTEIAHTSLYFNLGPTRTISGSDTQVLLYKDKPIEIIDPNGNIASATGSINNEDDLKRVVTFSITLSNSIQWSTSDLVIRAWNDNLNSGDTIVYDTINVAPSLEEQAFEESIPEPEVQQLKSDYVPIWIKNNAGWWSQELIDDSDFIAGIEYLIQQEIITLSDTGTIETNDSDEIPTWIKNNAGWWSDNLITEKEFIDGLQWLIGNGIIKVTGT